MDVRDKQRFYSGLDFHQASVATRVRKKTGGKRAGWGRGVDSRLSTMSSEKAGVERKGCRAWPDYTSVGASPHS